MILVSLRDLQFRRRRFAVGVAGTALVLGITLVLSGMTTSFDNEARRSTNAFNAEAWVVPEGSSGAFLSSATMPRSLADEVSASTGKPAAPIALLFGKIPIGDTPTQVNVHGVPSGSFAAPPLKEGRAVERPGETVVDAVLDLDIGDTVVLDEHELLVVGRTDGLTYRAGIATINIEFTEAQEIGFGGADLATAVVSSGPVAQLPAGTAVLTPQQVQDDLLEPMTAAKAQITTMQWLLWVVATMIIGSVVYLTALDRVRDFAVFKAMGAPDRSVLTGLIAQSLLLCALSYAVGIVISVLITPFMPLRSEVPTYAYFGLAVIAVVVGLASSVAGARRALSVDPALAFGGA